MFSLAGLTWKTKLIAMAALCVAFFLAGWVVHDWKTDASVARSIPKAQKTAQKLQNKADVIVDQGIKDKEVIREVIRTVKEKIYVQNDQSVCFSNESLKLWNDAIAAGSDSHRSEPAAEVTAANPVKRESDQESGQQPGTEVVATVEQVLINATDNFEVCKLNADDHDKLVDVLNIYKGRMCICSQ
jgi:hypothetical protein